MPLDFGKADWNSFGSDADPESLVGIESGPEVQLRSTLGEAMKVQPDAQARINKLSRDSGIPQFAVEPAPDEVEFQLKLDSVDWDAMSKRSPTTSAYLTDFNNAAIAHDDIDVMESLESALTSVKQYGTDISLSFEKGQRIVESSDIGLKRMYAALNAGEPVTDEQITRLKELETNLSKEIGDYGFLPGAPMAASEQLPILWEILQSGVLGAGGGAAAGGAVGAAAGAITGPGAAASATAGAFLGAKWGGRLGVAKAAFDLEAGMAFNEFASLKDENGVTVSPEVAGYGAATVGALNAALESLSFAALGRTVTPTMRLLMRNKVKQALLTETGREMALRIGGTYATAVAAESITEGLQELTNVIGAEFVKLADKDAFTDQNVSDVLDNVFSMETLERVGESAKKGAQASLILSTPGTVTTVVMEQRQKARIAEDEQVQIDAINTAASESKLKIRDNEAFKQFLNQADGDKNTNVFIDGVQASLYLSSKDRATIEADPALAMLQDQVNEASRLQTDINIPVSDFAASFTGTEHFDALRPHMTLSEDTVSPFRQEQVQAETQQYVQSLMSEAQGNVSQYVEAQEIFESVKAQLVDTGTVTPQNAGIMAQVVPAWATVFAQKNGISVQEAYQKAGLTIEGPQTGRLAELTDVLEQGVETKPPGTLGQINAGNPFLFNLDPTELQVTETGEKDITDFKGDVNRPITVTEVGGTYQILDGHHRAKIAIESGVPVRSLVIPNADVQQMVSDGIHQADMLKEWMARGGPQKHAPEMFKAPLRQEVISKLPDRSDIYRMMNSVEGTPSDLVRLTESVIDQHDALRGPMDSALTVLDDDVTGELLSAIMAKGASDTPVIYSEMPDKRAVIWDDKGNVYRVIRGNLRELSEEDGVELTANILDKVFADIRNNDPQESVNRELEASRRREEMRRERRLDEIPKVSPDFNTALLEVANWAENFQEFQKALSPSLFDISDRNRTRLGRARMSLPEDRGEYENAGDDTVTVYRAMPEGQEVEAGDWVSFNREYAAGHETNVDTGGAVTVEIEVEGTDVWWYGADESEWVYIPEGTWGEYQTLKEVWDDLTGGTKPDSYPAAEPLRQRTPASPDARGYFDPVNTVIRLTEASDLSTFLHEFAHFMYEMERSTGSDTAKSIGSWFKRNADAVAKEASGNEKDTTVTAEDVISFIDNDTTGDKAKDQALYRAVHEQFARGFETYLMEGKAPSLELRNAFRTFARWLTQVYRAVRGNLNVNLDAEMKQVFDRMLATEDQIAAAEARARYAPMFTDAVMAGMTEEEFASYQKQQTKTKDKQTETLRDKIIKELTRKTEKWWKDERKDLIEEETEALSKQQVYSTAERLRNGDIKLDLAAVKEMVGEDKVNKLGRKNRVIPPALRDMTAPGGEGVHPDEAAAFFGYNSGHEMLLDLITAPKLSDLAIQNAEQRMREIHGDIMNDGTIEREADEAVQNEERGKLILMELKALSKNTNTPAFDRRTVKTLAEDRIGKLSFREIFPGKYRKAEIAAAQESARMLAEGNREGAAVAKTRQVLNYYLGMAATEAKNDTMKIVDRMGRYNKKRVREAIQKADGGYWEQLTKILNRFEFRKSATLADVESLNTWVANKVDNEGDELVLSDQVMNELYVTHWKNVPYTELRGIADSVTNIEHVARHSNMINLLGEKVEFQKVKAKVLDQLNSLDTVFKAQRTTGQYPTGFTSIDKLHGTMEQAKDLAASGMSKMTKIPFLTRWMDGGEFGYITSLISTPFTHANDRTLTLHKEISEKISERITQRSKADRKRMLQKIFIPEIKDADNDGNLFGHQVVSVALNAGNAGNLRKMLIGEGWANPENEAEITIDNPQLQAVLKHMTKSDWELVQEIWDQLNLLYPMLEDVTHSASGVSPPKVDAVPFSIVVDGETIDLKGGYYPVVYDHERSETAAAFKLKREALVGSMFSTSGSINQSVSAGSSNKRTMFSAPILFDLGVISNHLQETIHYITHHDTVRQVNKIIRDPDIAKAIKQKMGREEYAKLVPWLNDIAKDGRTSEMEDFGQSLFRRLRFGTTYAYLAYKATTILIQPLGLTSSMSMVGGGRVLKALKHTITTSPVVAFEKKWPARDFALANSAVLRHRIKTFDREFKDAHKSLVGKDGFLDTARAGGMIGIGYVQLYVVDIPTWHAAYDKGLSDFEGDHRRSVDYADSIVKATQGSGDLMDTAELLRTKNEFARLFFAFMTWFSSQWNMTRDIARSMKLGYDSPADLIGRIFYLYVAGTVLEMMLRGELAPDDDEDLLDVLGRVTFKVATSPLTGVPYARDLIGTMTSDFGYNPSPMLSITEKGIDATFGVAKKLAEGEDVTRAQAKSVFMFAGALMNVPGTGQAWATGSHVVDVLSEGEDLTLREFIFGPERK